MASTQQGGQAIVLGGSIAGLLAARVLSEHYAAVTLIERDLFPAGAQERKGVPQAKHIHTLLTRGHDILLRFFPDLDDVLLSGGATLGDAAASYRSYRFGKYWPRFQSGLAANFQSRALLESEVRRRVLALPNVRTREQAEGAALLLDSDHARVTGVLINQKTPEPVSEQLSGELVVDATGRGSQMPKWLATFGYPAPPEQIIRMDLGYTSRVYRRRAVDWGGAHALLVGNDPPKGKRGGGIFQIEGDRWLVTLAGYLGDHAPTDDAGFLAFARSLPATDVYDAIKDAEPLGEIYLHRYPFSRRRYYEKLQHVPEGLIVMGDALCSFNPVFGQGMTVAALEAEMLERCLRNFGIATTSAERAITNAAQTSAAGGPHAGLSQQFFQAVAPLVDVPWSLASGADFRFPEVAGRRPRGAALINRYMDRLVEAALSDNQLSLAFLEVVHLMRPPGILFSPRIVARVLFGHAPRQNPPADRSVEAPPENRLAEATKP